MLSDRAQSDRPTERVALGRSWSLWLLVALALGRSGPLVVALWSRWFARGRALPSWSRSWSRSSLVVALLVPFFARGGRAGRARGPVLRSWSRSWSRSSLVVALVVPFFARGRARGPVLRSLVVPEVVASWSRSSLVVALVVPFFARGRARGPVLRSRSWSRSSQALVVALLIRTWSRTGEGEGNSL